MGGRDRWPVMFNSEGSGEPRDPNRDGGGRHGGACARRRGQNRQLLRLAATASPADHGTVPAAVPTATGAAVPTGPRAVVLVAFPDVQGLDVVGPLEVFASANAHGADPAYATAN